MRVFSGVDELRDAAGTELGVSDWVTVEQSRVDLFAEATDDHQWIHVDSARAAEGPFGTTIAHGFLSLSLLPALLAKVYRIDGTGWASTTASTGSGSPPRSRWAARSAPSVELLEVSDVTGGVQLTTRVTVQIAGSERPALVAEWITRQYV